VRQWGGEVVKLKASVDMPYQHFCLEVEGIETLRETLTSRGVAVTAIAVGMDGSKQCWIKDPDGNSIELMEYTPQSLQIQD
jgi:catechol 2,3-dioxygenase-like lactoylglutathione lyase family enzyme